MTLKLSNNASLFERMKGIKEVDFGTVQSLFSSSSSKRKKQQNLKQHCKSLLLFNL